MKKNILGLAALVASMPVVASAAVGDNTYGVDLSLISDNLITVGTLIIALAGAYAAFRFVKRLMGKA